MADDHNRTDWYDPAATTFGDRLTGAREAAGLDQAELARRLGVKTKTIAAWEGDQSEPRANRVSILCGILNVSLVWLLTGEGDGAGGPGAPGADGELLAEIQAIRRAAADLGDRLGVFEAQVRTRLEEDR